MNFNLSYYSQTPFIFNDKEDQVSKAWNIKSNNSSSVLSEITNNYKDASSFIGKKDIKTVVHVSSPSTFSMTLQLQKTVLQNSRGFVNSICVDQWSFRENGETVLNNIDHLKSMSNVEIVAETNDSVTVRLEADSREKLEETKHAVLSTYHKVIEKSLPIDSQSVDLVNLSQELKKISLNFNVDIYTGADSLIISGKEPRVLAAELRCKLYLDDSRGMHIDFIDLDFSLINLIGGVELNNFRNIIKQTGVFLYIPETILSENDEEFYVNNNRIFLSASDQNQLLYAKVLLKRLVDQEQEIYFKDLKLNPHKCLYLLMYCGKQLREIMFKNGSYLQFPNLTQLDDGLVRIQNNNTFFMEKTVKELMELMGDIYEFETNASADFSKDLLEIAKNHKIILLQKFNKYRFIGGNNSIKFVMKFVEEQTRKRMAESKGFGSILNINENLSSLSQKVNLTKNNDDASHSIRIELLNNEKEFICGKKNGKLIKVMNQTNTSIKFKALNEYNFIIEITSQDLNSLNVGLNLIELELPSELNFYIPEIYHKQIIGIKGNSIQSIMRKYNVFIKFSNTFEIKQNSMSFKRFNNVLIKCPKKNAMNIPKVKKELENLVLRESNASTSVNFKVSSAQLKLFLNQLSCSVINDIERKTNTFIELPENELTLDHELIRINTNCELRNSIEAFNMLKQSFPKQLQVTINSVSSISKNIKDDTDFLVALKIFFSVDVQFTSDTTLLLTYFSELGQSLEYLSSFLKNYDLKIIKKQELEFNYHLVEKKFRKPKEAYSHAHTQSLNLYNNDFQSYKHNLMRSPPIYSGYNGTLGGLSPIQYSIEPEIQRFSFAQSQAQAKAQEVAHSPISLVSSPVNSNFKFENNGLLPPYGYM